MSSRFFSLALGLVIIGLVGLAAGHAEDNRISVTADSTLRHVVAELTQTWADQHGDMRVELQFTNTATLQDQLVQGKAGDVVILANAADAKEAGKRGFLVDAERKKVAGNELIAYGRKGLIADEELEWFDLLGREWDNFALGDPALTASGRAARSAIEKHELGSRLKSDGVHVAGNESAALDFVRRSEADAVFLLKTDLDKTALTGFVVFPVDAADYPAIEYIAAPTKSTKSLPTAKIYIQYLTTPEAKAIWKKYGFRVD